MPITIERNRQSPNRYGRLIDYRFNVLHHTGVLGFDAIVNALCRPGSGASANYVIGKDGRVAEIVPPGIAAWHAGKGSGFGIPADTMNMYSTGIEMENLGDGIDPYTEAQLTALDELIVHLDNVMGKQAQIIDHKAWAGNRKVDMRANFPLAQYQTYRKHVAPPTHGVGITHVDCATAIQRVVRAATERGFSSAVVPVGEKYDGAVSHTDALVYVMNGAVAAKKFTPGAKHCVVAVHAPLTYLDGGFTSDAIAFNAAKQVRSCNINYAGAYGNHTEALYDFLTSEKSIDTVFPV